MSSGQQSALAALNSVRPIAERLDRNRDGEDRAADILELWDGTENALRALAGGSSLSGQALVRELRQREQITLTQAYALLEFLGARERANRTSYRATQADVDAAREGFRQLDAVVRQSNMGAPMTDWSRPNNQPTAPSQPAAAPPPAPAAQAATTEAAPVRRRVDFTEKKWWVPAAVVVLLIAIATVFWVERRGPDRDLNDAVDMLRNGRRESARAEFSRIARDNPNIAQPHIFLARLSREDGDLASARREAETAIRNDPTNAVAQREMGLVLFSMGNYDLARNFFIRALQYNPDDNASQGYLGCALMRLNRTAEASRFLSRAGPGSWSVCSQQAPQQLPPQ